MLLKSGDRIGTYEVSSLLGKGGMGEVYRARDLKLKREVAIKVLPSSLTGDRERMQRFMREAEVLASLNHPNIAQIYGFEDSDGVPAIVMELVEGETLADIIKRGPTAMTTTLDYAKQILAAFEYAHDRPKPIIHRDLKPANVKVTPEGVIKVLDFGLAKALTEERSESTDPELSPTLTLGPSIVGTILGTASYMSPEQAKGKNADRRSDIWSFGVLLYEMSTGQRPFTGPETADVLAAVINQEPKMDPVPARLRPAISRCLRKDPKKRWYSMEDVRFALDEEPQTSEVSVPQAQRSARIPWGIAALLGLIAVAALFVAWRATRPIEQPLSRFEVSLGADAADSGNSPTFAVSPDGRRIVFMTQKGLATRTFDQVAPTLLAGTERGRFPTFSPDGQWIAFIVSGEVKKISVLGGAPQTLAPGQGNSGLSWSDADWIAVGSGAVCWCEYPRAVVHLRRSPSWLWERSRTVGPRSCLSRMS